MLKAILFTCYARDPPHMVKGIKKHFTLYDSAMFQVAFLMSNIVVAGLPSHPKQAH